MNKTLLTIIIAFFLPVLLTAQASGSPAGNKVPQQIGARLVYFDDEAQVTVTDEKGKNVQVNFGMMLLPGYTIRTRSSSAEIQLVPNRTIIKLTPATTFQIEGLQGLDNAPSNDFSLISGKIRAVAATFSEPQYYSIRTNTSVLGVRGTDFALKLEPGKMDWVCVQEGEVEFVKNSTGESLRIKTGEFADTFAPAFAPTPVTPGRLAELFNDVSFTQLVPSEVPGKGPAASAAKPTTSATVTAATATTPVTDATVPPDTTKPATPAEVPTGVSGMASEAPAEADSTTEKPAESKPSKDGGLGSLLSQSLGFQAGAIVLDGVTYSQVILAPEIKLERFKMGLYLPIVYSKDLFDPENWYKPAGNNEWSFGFDQSFGDDWLARGQDFLSDLLLKIKYIELGKQGEDDLFFKMGNLNTMTLGNGSLMRNYANDEDFPTVRRIGINSGVSFGPVGMEIVLDDAADLSIIGGRIFTDLVPSVGLRLGVSGLVDLKPDANSPISLGKPLLTVGGIDVRWARLDLGILSASFFTDFGTVLPYYQEAVGSVGSGFAWDVINRGGSLKNFGVSTGVFGKVLIADYRLDFRWNQGLFKNNLFGATYNRTKAEYVTSLTKYALGLSPDIDDTNTFGVYGEANLDFFGLAKAKAGYYLPVTLTGNNLSYSNNDQLVVKLEIEKGTIPMIDLFGSISYERTNFFPTLLGWMKTEVNLFDINTTFKGELLYSVFDNLDLAVVVSTSIARDLQGKIIYLTDGYTPRIIPTITVETRVSF